MDFRVVGRELLTRLNSESVLKGEPTNGFPDGLDIVLNL